MKREDEFGDIWELYGVRENPFSTSPILVIGGTIPRESFVGRDENVNRLKKILGSKGGSRTLVYGDVGVGKTTFVNVVRSQAMKARIFTPVKEIAVLSEWNSEAFVKNTLEAFYATMNLIDKRPISSSTYKTLQHLVGLEFKERGVSGSILGTGGGYSSKTTSSIRPTVSALQSFFQKIISEIYKSTRKEIIIHYNNLELLPEKVIRRIFDDLRDFFQTERVHFVFVGNLMFYSTVQGLPRFSSILSDTPIHIENLSFEEVREVIKIRFDKLKIKNHVTNTVIPCTDDALRALYDLFNGNIRNILNSLSIAVREVTKERPLTLNSFDLALTLKNILEHRYLAHLPKRAKGLLLEAVKSEEVTNRYLSLKTGVARPNISTYLRQLQEAGCIYLRRKDGKDKFWSVDPVVKWHLLKIDAKAKSQRKVTDFE